MGVLLDVEAVRFFGDDGAPDLGEGDEEELPVAEGDAGELVGFGLVAHVLEVSVVGRSEAAVVRYVLAECLVAVDVLAVDFVFACRENLDKLFFFLESIAPTTLGLILLDYIIDAVFRRIFPDFYLYV